MRCNPNGDTSATDTRPAHSDQGPSSHHSARAGCNNGSCASGNNGSRASRNNCPGSRSDGYHGPRCPNSSGGSQVHGSAHAR